MSVITLPSTLKMGPGGGIGQRRYDLVSQSDATGAAQVRLLGPPRWTLQLVQCAVLTLAEAGAWAALVMKLRGRVNVLAAWDPVKGAAARPSGSIAGTLTLTSSHTAGAVLLYVSGGVGQAFRTIAAGDYFTVGSGVGSSQMVMCTADNVTDGSGNVILAIEPPLRLGFASGAAVAWDKPLAYYRLQNDATTWSYANGGTMVTGFSLDLLETFA